MNRRPTPAIAVFLLSVFAGVHALMCCLYAHLIAFGAHLTQHGIEWGSAQHKEALYAFAFFDAPPDAVGYLGVMKVLVLVSFLLPWLCFAPRRTAGAAKVAWVAASANAALIAALLVHQSIEIHGFVLEGSALFAVSAGIFSLALLLAWREALLPMLSGKITLKARGILIGCCLLYLLMFVFLFDVLTRTGL